MDTSTDSRHETSRQAGEPVVSLRDITRRFGSILAVDGVSFDVHRGEVVGFLGPNAAGKTTTMRILTCFITADEGTATVAGYDVVEDPIEVRRRVGYLPESAPLYTDLGVLEHLRFVAELRGIPPRDVKRSVDRMVDACGLEPVAQRIVGELSKGYRQRVGLANTMIHDPDVLVLDEPTTGLDPSQIIEIRELVRRIGREKTVILSTHILPEVEAVSSRVLIINAGRIVATGTPGDLARMTAGRGAVRVSMLAPEREALAALSALPCAQDVERVAKEPGGYVVYSVSGSDSDSLAEAVYDLSRARNWRLRELSRKTPSLEDVFLDVTSGRGRA